jgi:hypothetical protein
VTGSITDILPSAAATLGVPGARDRLGLTDRIGRPQRVVVVLVDGLGHTLLPRLASHAPLLASVLAGTTGHLEALTCTFPSTTPTSLVSLGTGANPGEHGVLGFTLRVPDTGRLLTHVTWRDDPPVSRWQPVPTWWSRAAAAGIDTRAVLPAAYLGSGLTRAAYGGAKTVGVADHDDYATRLVEEVQRGPGLVYGYTSVLDTAGHVHGIASEQWLQAATDVDRLLTRVVEELPPGSALLVTADHGGLDIPRDRRVDVADVPALSAGVTAIAGEPRVRYVHTEAGAHDDVRAAWTETLGDDAEVMLRDAAVASGLFGPVTERNIARLGDVVVISRGDAAVMATGHEPPEMADVVGLHGALTTDEVTIPLVSIVV